MTETIGKIVDIDEVGAVTIIASVPRLETALMQKWQSCIIRFHDGRRISPEQRRMIYALIHEISDWAGYMREDEDLIKRQMKLEFIANRMESIALQMFSLSSVDMTTAREFIDFLLAFIIKHGIPTRIPLAEAAHQYGDVERYVYACLMSKRCAVCGRDAHLHHVDSVGAHGGSREKINHLGLRCLPLCAEHHSELHGSESRTGWYEAYHLEPVKIDKRIAKLYHLHTE